MLSEIFYWVLNMSILASLAGLIVYALGKIKSLPRFGIYLLWLLPGFRFWLPVGLASKYSLSHLLFRYVTKTIVVWESADQSPVFTMTNSIRAASHYFPLTFRSQLLAEIFRVGALVWLIVAAGMILSSLSLYIFTKEAVKDAEPLRDNVYLSDKLLSPAVYGVMKPKIILPSNTSLQELDLIIRHETVHIQRKDNFWRILAVLTACLHWFNPLVWIFLKQLISDMELACDAKVAKDLPLAARKEYARLLLRYSQTRSAYASAFGGAKTRIRIENILSYKKLTVLSAICFSLFFVIVAVTVITNAAG